MDYFEYRVLRQRKLSNSLSMTWSDRRRRIRTARSPFRGSSLREGVRALARSFLQSEI
jgi:hypothetical protein